MGISPSASADEETHRDDLCFIAIPTFHELMARKLSAIGSPEDQKLDTVLPSSKGNPATPKRKLCDRTEDQMRKPKPRTNSASSSSPESYLVDRELESINGEQAFAARVWGDEEFVLVEPGRLLGDKSSFLIVDDGSSSSPTRPPFRPKLRLLPSMNWNVGASNRAKHSGSASSHAQHASFVPTTALPRFNHRLMQEDLPGADSHCFIPIPREGEEVDECTCPNQELPQKPSASRPSGFPSSTFRLQPRKGRHRQDLFKFQL